MVKIQNSSIVTAFAEVTIGSKVLDQDAFLKLVVEGINSHDPSKDRAEGQHFIMLPADVTSLVSCGVGKRTQNPDDYVNRLHHKRVTQFLRREHAAEVTGCAVVVYTKAAYTSDPDVTAEQRGELKDDTTHVLVAVLAFGGPDGTELTPYRFTANLGGGNNEALEWSADEIRKKASAIKQYDDTWSVVAD